MHTHKESTRSRVGQLVTELELVTRYRACYIGVVDRIAVSDTAGHNDQDL